MTSNVKKKENCRNFFEGKWAFSQTHTSSEPLNFEIKNKLLTLCIK